MLFDLLTSTNVDKHMRCGLYVWKRTTMCICSFGVSMFYHPSGVTQAHSKISRHEVSTHTGCSRRGARICACAAVSCAVAITRPISP